MGRASERANDNANLSVSLPTPSPSFHASLLAVQQIACDRHQAQKQKAKQSKKAPQHAPKDPIHPQLTFPPPPPPPPGRVESSIVPTSS